MRRLFAAISIALLVPALPASASHDALVNGVVTRDGTSQPLESICVTAMSDDWGWFYAITYADGSYAMSIPRGDFTFLFEDCGDNNVLSEYYDDVASYDDATIVMVGDGPIQVDASLATGGIVEGTTRDVRGDTASTCVTALDAEGNYLAETWAEDGSYRLQRLPFGPVVVQFGCTNQGEPVFVPRDATAPSSEDAATLSSYSPYPGYGYIAEFYDDVADFQDATPIIVTDEPTTGIDAILADAGGIVGFVTDEAGTPLDDICVTAWDGAGNYAGSGWTWGGDFTLGGLTTGNYTVSLDDCFMWPARYRSEYFDDVTDPADATTIAVIAGEGVSISAALTELPRPDLAVSGLSVTPVPIQTDATTVPGPGHERTIAVEVSNLGTRTGSDGYLEVWAQTRTDGQMTKIAEEELAPLAPGGGLSRTYRWSALRTIGDVTISAHVCLYDDSDQSNNERSVEAYGFVGGSGAGATAPTSFAYEWSCRGPVR